MSQTLEQILSEMTEEDALAFVKKKLHPERTAWVVCKDGESLNVPDLLVPGTILLTVNDGQVSEVEIIPGTFK